MGKVFMNVKILGGGLAFIAAGLLAACSCFCSSSDSDLHLARIQNGDFMLSLGKSGEISLWDRRGGGLYRQLAPASCTG